MLSGLSEQPHSTHIAAELFLVTTCHHRLAEQPACTFLPACMALTPLALQNCCSYLCAGILLYPAKDVARMNTYMPVNTIPIENRTRTVNQKLRRPLQPHTPQRPGQMS